MLVLIICLVTNISATKIESCNLYEQFWIILRNITKLNENILDIIKLCSDGSWIIEILSSNSNNKVFTFSKQSITECFYDVQNPVIYVNLSSNVNNLKICLNYNSNNVIGVYMCGIQNFNLICSKKCYETFEVKLNSYVAGGFYSQDLQTIEYCLNSLLQDNSFTGLDFNWNPNGCYFNNIISNSAINSKFTFIHIGKTINKQNYCQFQQEFILFPISPTITYSIETTSINNNVSAKTVNSIPGLSVVGLAVGLSVGIVVLVILVILIKTFLNKKDQIRDKIIKKLNESKCFHISTNEIESLQQTVRRKSVSSVKASHYVGSDEIGKTYKMAPFMSIDSTSIKNTSLKFPNRAPFGKRKENLIDLNETQNENSINLNKLIKMENSLVDDNQDIKISLV